MRVLFIGDIVGKPGREILKKHLPGLKKEINVDIVIANCENLAHGFGMTAKTIDEVILFGVDIITGGNHSWDKKEINPFYDSYNMLRPINFPDGVCGRGSLVFEKNSQKLAVVNLLGHYGMGMVENPFNMIEKEVQRLQDEGIKNIVIDFHAEATSEKNALLFMLKSQVSFIAGTHTHIGTDDLLIKDGTGYISDVGLTGCMDGIIGMDIDAPIYRFKTGIKKNYDIPKKCKKIFQAIIIDIDENGRCIDAKKIKAYDDQAPAVSMESVRI